MLLQFLETFADLITSVLGIIVNFFAIIITLLTTIPKAIAYIIGAVGYMPPFVGSIIVVGIGISIAITVVNHWGN